MVNGGGTGLGDELMALCRAEEIHRQTCARVVIADAKKARRWSEVWENHPAIVQKDEPLPANVRGLIDCPGHRAYIAGWGTYGGKPRLIFDTWKIREHAGTLHLSEAEAAYGRQVRAKLGRYVVIQPSIRLDASPNKDWGWDRYQDLVFSMKDVTFVQVGPAGTKLLEGVTPVPTARFRDAWSILKESDAYVGPEGGLHIAAGLLRRPGVVLFGGFGSPKATGFPWHHNIADEGPESPCGRWAFCTHCEEIMKSISVSDVKDRLAATLQGAGEAVSA